MKKTLIALAILTPSVSFGLENHASQEAGSVFGDIRYTYQDYTHDSTSISGFGIGLGYSPFSWLDLDVQTDFGSVTLEDDLFNFSGSDTQYTVDVGAKGYFGFTNSFGAFSRISLGHTWDVNQDVSLVSFQPGFYVKPFANIDTDNQTKVEVSYRYQDATGGEDGYKTDAFVIGGEYEFIKGHSVTGQYSYVTDDREYDAFGLGYRVRF